MAARQHEAVAVGPLRVGRVVAHHPVEQHVGQRRERHGRAGVAVAGPLGSVHGEAPDDVDGQILELAGRSSRLDPTHQPGPHSDEVVADR